MELLSSIVTATVEFSVMEGYRVHPVSHQFWRILVNTATLSEIFHCRCDILHKRDKCVIMLCIPILSPLVFTQCEAEEREALNGMHVYKPSWRLTTLDVMHACGNPPMEYLVTT